MLTAQISGFGFMIPPPGGFPPTETVKSASLSTLATTRYLTHQAAVAVNAGQPPVTTQPSAAVPVSISAGGKTAIGPSVGAIGRFNRTRRVWSIYSPSSSGMYGIGVSTLSGACLFGNCGLADTPPDPAAPSGYVKTGESPTLPTGVQDAGTEQDRPWYKNPWVWAGVGGAAVLGVGGWMILR